MGRGRVLPGLVSHGRGLDLGQGQHLKLSLRCEEKQRGREKRKWEGWHKPGLLSLGPIGILGRLILGLEGVPSACGRAAAVLTSPH